MPKFPMLIGAVLLAGVSLAASAQPFYPPYLYAPPPGAAPTPWYYNPYTSGLGPCPQRRGGSDPPCRETIEPSYGQPNYWPR